MAQTLRPLIENGKRIDGYFFDPSTEIVYFFKSIGGKKVKFSTKIKRTSYRQAQIFANRRLKDLFGDRRISFQPLIKDEIPKWVLVKEAEGLDPKTMRKVHQAIARIEPFWGSMFPKNIDADSFAAWMKWLDEKEPGKIKFNWLKYFKGLCHYMHSKQFEGMPLLPAIPIMKDPSHKFNIARRKKKTERIFTRTEYRKIIKVANPVECLAAEIMYKMATRIEETLSLSYQEQVVSDGGWKYVWSVGQNKADLIGQHYFPDSLNKALTARRALVAGSQRLFPQERDKTKALKPQQIDWAGWRKRANLGWHWTSKTFRHTCLSNLFNDPKNPQAIVCVQYRISPQVAADTYIKPTPKTLERLKNVSDSW